MTHNGLQLQEVGDFEASAAADLPPQNPSRVGHKALFNPDPSGNRQFLVGAVASWPSIPRHCQVGVLLYFYCHLLL